MGVRDDAYTAMAAGAGLGAAWASARHAGQLLHAQRFDKGLGRAPVRPDLVLVAADLLDVEPEVVADAGAAPAVALRVLGAGHDVRTLLPAVVARESFLRGVLLRLPRRASLGLCRAAELGRGPGPRRWWRRLCRGQARCRRRREAANGPGQRSGGRLRTHHSYPKGRDKCGLRDGRRDRNLPLGGRRGDACEAARPTGPLADASAVPAATCPRAPWR